MNGPDYVFAAYTVGLAMLWGYAMHLWLLERARRRRRPRKEATS